MSWWHWVLIGSVSVASAAVALVVRAMVAPVQPLGTPTANDARVRSEALARAEREAAEKTDAEIKAVRAMTAGELVERARELAAKGRK